jgi:polysaccharide biosynthesis/export protein
MKRLILVVLLIAGAMSTWAQTKEPEQTPSAAQAAPAAPKDADQPVAKSATDDPTYVIGPEDVISVSVWKEPDFSNTVPVRPDGMVTLALLGDVMAAGKTPAQLASDVTSRLTKYIEQPRVTVVVTAINSRRIFILGEVNHPGAVAMSANMTVLQAITAAGGPTAYANTKKVNILRTEQGKQSKYLFNYKEVVKGNNSEQNILLKAGDTIVVP